MSNDDSMAGGSAPRRVPRQGVGGAPAGSTLMIVLALVAVVAGFLILRDITDDGGLSAGGDVSDGATDGALTTLPPDDEATAGAGEDTTPTSSSTTTVAQVTDGATVVVVNVNTEGGSAGRMTDSLELEGYTMGAATNGAGPDIDDTIVYFDESVAAARDVAGSVARDLGGVEVLPVPSPIPTENESLDGAGVLVMLGNNQAGQSVAELQEAAGTGEAETAPAPEVSGDDATTDTAAGGDDATQAEDTTPEE